MGDLKFSKSKIYNEMKPEDKKYWFKYIEKKYIHNIDTLYYTVEIPSGEWRIDSEDMHVKNFLTFLDEKKKETVSGENVAIGSSLIMNGYSFGFYNYDIEKPDCYMFLIASHLPNKDTPAVVVQIRSTYLWLYGVDRAIKDSLADLTELLNEYYLTVGTVKVNRVDYCWHTNYIQNPESFLKLDNIARMRVSHMRSGDLHFEFSGDNDYSVDYLRLGRLNSNNMLLRIYNKGREVVEMGYKSFFFYTWFFQGMISRYDLYCYEECYRLQSWTNLNKARLNFYIEYGLDESKKVSCQNLITSTDYDAVKKLADELTPSVTLVLNVEFQTKRKFYSTINFINYKQREGKTIDLMICLDNRKLVTDYLTFHGVRFTDYRREDLRKQDRPLIPFWERLRNTKFYDAPMPPKSIEMVRTYAKELDREKVKRRVGHMVATHGIYNQNFNVSETSLYTDFLDFVSSLNDNDMKDIQRYKEKRVRQLKEQVDKLPKSNNDSTFSFFNKITGEVIDFEQTKNQDFIESELESENGKQDFIECHLASEL